ncbi:MAG: GtrA family protein [Deltaproteobacteria bacterium]|nr:GtrA family protein [Deltaproteobacteria bacterium]
MRPLEKLTRFVRASGVGILASLLDLAVLTLLVRGFRFSPQAANVPALLCGAVVQFAGARHVVFGAADRDIRTQLLRFALAEVGTLALNALGFALLTHFTPLPFPLARLAATLLVFVGFSFPAWTRVFRSQAANA